MEEEQKLLEYQLIESIQECLQNHLGSKCFIFRRKVIS